MAVTAVVSAVGMAVDGRTVAGAPVWFKPLKFSVSFLAYALVLAWMLSLQRRPRRAGRWAGTVVAVTGAVEMAVIVGQAARGRRSHFNFETPLDQALFSVMGLTIVVLWSASLLLALLLLHRGAPGLSAEPAAVSALRSGAFLALAGMALGFLMLLPTPEQRAAERPTVRGAHSVGVPDGGPGMPLTGWSTTGGDLRVPHFVGMHALQGLPLFSAGLAAAAARAPRRSRLRDSAVRLRLVRTAAGTTAALLALVTWQALRGQPLLAPDPATLGALGGILAASAAVSVASLRLPVRRRSTPRGDARQQGTRRENAPLPAESVQQREAV
ncbi:hypothetical protein ACFV1B_15335 [Streptomyces sp. NPDC059637]|uniref:hypothetical protein n=1 Tax=Streptomyces sp. NPDC059637 TaxID=3347752 RepID=UPI0036A0A410